MGLNPRSRGRGRGRGQGGKGLFLTKGRRGGRMVGQGPMFRPIPPGMFCPLPMGFPSEPLFNGPFHGGPSGFNYGPPRSGFGKFPRKNFKKKAPQKNFEAPVPDIDLSKPWVTEEIKSEENKKQEYLETWRKSKNDEDWSKYKTQKMTVQTLYDKAKTEYMTSHPEKALLWQNDTDIKKYYCETCDKSFRTDDDLILHEAEHETCGKEGCDFVAHPKVIAKHIKMQHNTGLFKRIGKLYTKEDIAKWIEERRKRYPSKKVIEEKKALEEEKIKRGERINDDTCRFNKSFQNKNKSSGKKTFNKIKTKKCKNKKKNQTIQQYEEKEESDIRNGVAAFLGLVKYFEEEKLKEEKEKGPDISDDEWEDKSKLQVETNPILSKCLQWLASNYESDDEIDDIKEKTGEYSDDEVSGPEEVKTCRSATPIFAENSKENCISKKRKGKSDVQNNKRKMISSSNKPNTRNLTLLEKLLKNEIRHERNVILQCVHYVVKNNFFNS